MSLLLALGLRSTKNNGSGILVLLCLMLKIFTTVRPILSISDLIPGCLWSSEIHEGRFENFCQPLADTCGIQCVFQRVLLLLLCICRRF